MWQSLIDENARNSEEEGARTYSKPSIEKFITGERISAHCSLLCCSLPIPKIGTQEYESSGG